MNNHLMRTLCSVLLYCFLEISLAQANSWNVEKGQHFIIEYANISDKDWAREVLNASERYYDKIADQIGYSRYQNYWTWDQRAKIVVYADQESFSRETHQPAWSRGGAISRDGSLFQSRTIITFKQEEGFLEGVLPHEICHLILRDFIGDKRDIPHWLDEGIAQMQEEGKKSKALKVMKVLVKENNFYPLNDLVSIDIRQENDSRKVSLFYAQSICVVSFLIDAYGSHSFLDFCRALKDGKNFETALEETYHLSHNSFIDLQNKWVDYMLQLNTF